MKAGNQGVYFSNRSTRSRALLSTATLLLVFCAIIRALDPLPEGLHATYFSDANWSSSPVQSRIESRPSTDSLIDAWRANPPGAFSTTWSGSFVALRAGTYRFGTRSDDGSWVYVDQQLVVDNGGRHSLRLATGDVHLEQGVHAIFIKYFQGGGDFQFELLWAREAAPLELMPVWSLSTRHVTFSRFLASVIVRRAWTAAVVLWLAVFAVAGVVRLRRSLMRITVRKDDRVYLVLVGLIIGSCALNLAGVWWGLPSRWAGDEIGPKPVLIGLSQRFTNGWFDRYPPFHFYVLSAVFSPWLLLKSLGWIRVSDTFEIGALVLFSRLASVIAGVGTLLAVYVCGADAFSKRAGLFATATFALLTPFVYYAKTANPEVPYIFWFALSLVFYVRMVRALAVRNVVLFSAAATLAICTKDQAYALYLSAPFVIAYLAWQSNRERGRSHPLLRALVDVRLGVAAITVGAVLATCYQIPFNLAGFISHVRDIAGPGSQPYQMVPPTLGGRLTLLRLTAFLDQMSWGWPLWLASAFGVPVTMTHTEARRVAVCLLLVAVSYYVGFIDVVLYVYDRYLLPICLVQALFAGAAIDTFLRWPDRARQPWRLALVGAALGYTFLYAAAVDVLMIRDSRYTVERWLRDHVGHNHLVGTMFPLYVLPRLGDFQWMDIGTIDELRVEAPADFILNADYARAVPADKPLGQLIAGLQHETLGYRLVFRYRSPAPWPWLPAPHADLVGPRLETRVYSILRDINPTIEIYGREPAPWMHQPR
jgi:fibro-slime domain-containing protein